MKYRTLKNDEIIQEGDESCSKTSPEWHDSRIPGHPSIGCTVKQWNEMYSVYAGKIKFRRPIQEAQSLKNKTTE